MSKTFLLLLAAAFAAVPLSHAHVDGTAGLPKSYCEDVEGDVSVHDYGAPSSGVFVVGPVDGSAPGCPHDLLTDGHTEFGLGGAYLLACDLDCSGESIQTGSVDCWGLVSDHAPYPTIHVEDVGLAAAGEEAVFRVLVDSLDNISDGVTDNACGDGELDYGAWCQGSCAVDFPPGIDGSYVVFVEGTFGHVWT